MPVNTHGVNNLPIPAIAYYINYNWANFLKFPIKLRSLLHISITKNSSLGRNYVAFWKVWRGLKSQKLRKHSSEKTVTLLSSWFSPVPSIMPHYTKWNKDKLHKLQFLSHKKIEWRCVKLGSLKKIQIYLLKIIILKINKHRFSLLVWKNTLSLQGAEL